MQGKLRGNPPLVLASFFSEILFFFLCVEASLWKQGGSHRQVYNDHIFFDNNETGPIKVTF